MQLCSYSNASDMVLSWVVRVGFGAIRDSPYRIRDGPGRSEVRFDTVLGPAWSGVGQGQSVALPCWSWVIRVGSVFIRSAAVLSPV